MFENNYSDYVPLNKRDLLKILLMYFHSANKRFCVCQGFLFWILVTFGFEVSKIKIATEVKQKSAESYRRYCL